MNHIWILFLVLAVVPAHSEGISSTVPATVASSAARLSLTNDAAPNRITIDGVTYEEVRWGNVTPSTVTIFHKTGVATISLAKLPPELQKRFGYDPVKVESERKKREAEADSRTISARPGKLNGLTPVSNDDGKFIIEERNGVPCWLVPKETPANCFYLDADNDFLPKSGSLVEIDLTFFDAGSGSIVLHYDSTDSRLPNAGAYKAHPREIQRMNSGHWKLIRFYVGDALFANRENGRTDFRFYSQGDDLLISDVRVLRIDSR